MKKLKCSVCGYTPDETKSVSESEIKLGMSLDEIHAKMLCPVCGTLVEAYNEIYGTEEVKNNTDSKKK